MKYFSQLESIPYPNLEADDNTFRIMKNILTRSAFLSEIIENSAVFYDYNIKEGETPELIAHKLYGTVERFWIVLMFNKLHNPYYDFPLDEPQLQSYIESKYGLDFTTAQTTHHHWERAIRRIVYTNGVETDREVLIHDISGQQANSETGLAEDLPALPGVGSTSQYDETDDTVDATTRVVNTYYIRNRSVYDYEFGVNEAKRKIKLLDPKYAGKVESEFKRLMND